MSAMPAIQYCAIPEKAKEEEWVEGMEFPGLLKKEHVEIPQVSSKRSGISRGVQKKKIMCHSHVELFLGLGF